MDQIKSYIDAVFAGMPNTKVVAEMKQDILESMQERYKELLSQGNNENEALGIVISQFGNIDEIKKELGMEDAEEEKNNSTFYKNPDDSLNVISLVPAFIFPPILLFLIAKNKDWIACMILLCTVSIYLVLGFSLSLWHPGWIIFPCSFLIIIIRWLRMDSKINTNN